MGTVYIDKEKLEHAQQLGFGACSTVYKAGDKAVKILNEKGKEITKLENITRLTNMEHNDAIVFPEDIVMIDGEFSGYTMEYVNGTQLRESIASVDLEELSAMIRKAEADIATASKNGLLFEDLNPGGILLDEQNRRIKIIDTDFFIIREGSELQNSDSQRYVISNINEFSETIQTALGISDYGENVVQTYLHTNKEYLDFHSQNTIDMSLHNKAISAADCIEKVLEVVERDYGFRPKTWNDLQGFLAERDKSKGSLDDLAEGDKSNGDLDDDAARIAEMFGGAAPVSVQDVLKDIEGENR